MRILQTTCWKIEVKVVRDQTKMATAKSFEKHLSCPICLETFSEPKILPCVHSFCESCLHSHVRSSTSDQSQWFECPMCRVTTYPAKKESPVSKWAHEFPSNHLIVSMLEDSVQPGMEQRSFAESAEMICSPCALQNKQETVFSFCVTCCEYLCENCHNYHSKFKLMRNHQILKGKNLPKDISHFKRMSAITVCKFHNDREIEYLCLVHKEFICSTCVKCTHRNCYDVEDITNLPVKGDVYSEYAKESKGLKEKVEKVLQCNLDGLETFDRKSTALLETQSSLIAELRTLLSFYDIHEQNSMTKSREKVESIKAKMSGNITDCTGFTDALRIDSEFAEIFRTYGKNKHRTLIMETLCANQREIERGLSRLEQDNVIPKFGILPEEAQKLKSLKALIEKRLELEKELGDSTHSDKISKQRSTDSYDRQSEAQSSCSFRSFMQCDVRKIAEYDISVKLLSPTRCSHRSCALLNTGNMVFIDDSNDVLKLVSPEFKVLDYHRLENHPYDVAIVDKQAVAVAEGKRIHLFRIQGNNTFQKERMFATKDIVFSVCPIGNKLGLLYSEDELDTDETYVEIRSTGNKILDTIDDFCNKTGDIIDMNHAFLIRSRNNDEIMIAEQRQIKTFDLDGDLRWYFKYNGHSIRNIDFDAEKNIYICDYHLKRIHQVSANSFKKHRVLIPETGANAPRCILVNSKKRTLVVGSSNCNLVQVYQFL